MKHVVSVDSQWAIVVLVLAPVAAPAAAADDVQTPSGILFREGFDDADLVKRGWYDGGKFTISTDQPQSGKGCIEYRWNDGGTTVVGSSPVRRLFEPSDTVYVRFDLRLSRGWGWSGRGHHPHLVYVMTTENGRFHGPAASHLTLYVEPWNGKLRLATQDIQNQDMPHGLTQGPLRGGYNGRFYDSAEAVFTEGRWHRVEALFNLNSLDLERDKPVADGIVRGWVDGRLVVDHCNVVLRSTDFPRMKLNHLLLAPYFGSGLLPHAQSLWIDELTVGTGRPEPEDAGGEPRGDRAESEN